MSRCQVRGCYNKAQSTWIVINKKGHPIKRFICYPCLKLLVTNRDREKAILYSYRRNG